MADIQGGLNSTSQAEDQTLQAPPQEEIVQSARLKTSPEDNLIDQSISDYKKQSLLLNNQIQKMIDSYGKRTSMVNPKLAALSEGLGSDTPFFGTAFSKGIAGMAKADAEEQKQMADEAKMRMELIKAGQELSQKEIIAQLAPKLFKVDANGAFTGEIDNAIAQKMVSLTGDVGIIQKVIEMTKPQIGELAPGAALYDKRKGTILAKNPKEATPSDLKKKEDELDAMKKELAKDPTNETLKRNVKYHEDELKKLDQLEFPDDVLTMLARQALVGDTSVFANVGRGTQGPNNLVRLRGKMNEIMKANGMTPEDIAAKNAEFFGIKAGERTLGTRGTNIELASQEFLNIVPIAKGASEKVSRSKLLPFGKLQVLFDENVNDPDLAEFAAANNGIINTYARAISPTGVPTVSDKMHARKIISEAKNKEAYDRAITTLEREIEAAKASPRQVRENIRNEITGNAPTATKNKPTAQGGGKHYLNNREIVVKGNKWVYADTGEVAQ
jgi:hypothetical protein